MLLTEKQKLCGYNCKVTNDLLFIDKRALSGVWENKKNLEVVWIYYKKTYDTVSHSWNAQCLGMVQVSDMSRII